MSPVHHPTDEFLVDHVAGTLSAPKALLVATHLAMCPACRAEVAFLEDLGGALLEALDASRLTRVCAEGVLARAEAGACGRRQAAAAAVPPPPGPGCPAPPPSVPRPLRDHVPDLDAATGWRPLSFGVSALDLPVASAEHTRVRLLRMDGGAVVPRHRHAGDALALILRGRFAADGAVYGPGDVVVADETVTHEGRADPREGCICLSVADERPRFVGPLGPLRNLFARF